MAARPIKDLASLLTDYSNLLTDAQPALHTFLSRARSDVPTKELDNEIQEWLMHYSSVLKNQRLTIKEAFNHSCDPAREDTVETQKSTFREFKQLEEKEFGAFKSELISILFDRLQTKDPASTPKEIDLPSASIANAIEQAQEGPINDLPFWPELTQMLYATEFAKGTDLIKTSEDLIDQANQTRKALLTIIALIQHKTMPPLLKRDRIISSIQDRLLSPSSVQFIKNLFKEPLAEMRLLFPKRRGTEEYVRKDPFLYRFMNLAVPIKYEDFLPCLTNAQLTDFLSSIKKPLKK